MACAKRTRAKDGVRPSLISSPWETRRRASERQRERAVAREDLRAKRVLDALERGGVVRVEAQHQHGRSIGRAHQTPAVGPIRAQAVDGGNARAIELRTFPETRNERVVLAF